MHFVNAKGILSAHNGMNVYRGCAHGCIYCDSRSVCYQIKHEFEDIEVKQNAVELLESALRRKKRKCMIGTGSMCDPYMPVEDELRITRGCLEVIEKYGFGATVLTKSNRVLRDIDILKRINSKTKAVVQITLTTYDEKLCGILEPHVCSTYERYKALVALKDAGIPTVVWLSPILPFINDTEANLMGVLDYCFDARVKGIINFGFGVTLREGDREYFYEQLDRHFPGMRGAYARKFGNSYECMSDNNAHLTRVFKRECAVRGVMCENGDVFGYLHEFPEPDITQLSLF